MRTFDLRSLRFGEQTETWRRLPVDVEPFHFGGLEYVVPGGVVDLDLHAARVNDRLTLAGTFAAAVRGPCQRCLAESDLGVEARGLEYVRGGESESEDDGEAPYVHGFRLDVERWVRDLLAEALPLRIVCREDCAGLCPVCGIDLNAHPDHRHDGTTAEE